MQITDDPDDEPLVARLQRMIAGYRLSQAIYVAAKLGLADLLAAGPRTSGDLARQTATHEPSLRRLLCGLAGVDLFADDADGRWSGTPLAALLQSDGPGSLRHDAILYGEPWSWKPWGELLWSVQTGEAAFPHVFGVGRFEYLATHPEAAAIFNAAMTGSSAASAAALVGYDLSGIGTLVDVGGGQGATLAALLPAHPNLRGILFDLPHVVAEAAAVLAAAGVADRCTVVGGDFFREVPAGGDAYLLRHVLHNWDDERALAILATCRDAIGASGKLLVEDTVVAPSGETSETSQRSDPLLLDLHMLVAHGGRERTAEEFRRLFATAGFSLKRIVPIAGALCVIEADPA